MTLPLLTTIALSIILIALAACAAAEPIATVIGVSGKGAKIIVAGSNYEVDVAPKKELNKGDTIKTPPGAVVSVLMKDGTQIKVNELSRITIGQSKPGGVADMAEVKQGAVWAKVAQKPGGFEIKTPTATAGVRGTELALSVEQDGSKSTLTIVEGTANFHNDFGAVDLAAGQQSFATPNSPPSPPVVVDTRFFIEWTANVESIGSNIEMPLVSPNRYVLEDMAARYTQKTAASTESAEDIAAIAGVNYDLGDFEKAESLFNRSLEIKDNEQAAFGLGMTLLRTGRSEEAAAFFSERIEKSAGAVPANFLIGLGLAQLKQNNTEKAGETFGRAIEADNKSCMAWAGKGLVEMKLADFDKAEAALRSGLIADANCYQATTRLAELELSRNNFDAALKLALSAADRMIFSPEAQSTLAKVQFFKGDTQAAKIAALRAVELDGFHSGARDILAMIAVAEGQLRDATTNALTAIALDPFNAHAHDVLAQVYMLRRNREAAILHWERAIEAVPTYVPAHLHIAQLLNTIHKSRKAEEHLAVALEIEPENDRALGEMGRSLELQLKFDEAEKYYIKAVEINPGYAKTHARLASFYIDRFRLRDALREANAAVAAEPSNPAGYLALGLIHDELDNTESASLNYKQALLLDPENAEARYRLGIILGEDRGRFFEALSEMRRAQLIEPTVIVREELRDDRRYSLVFGENDYLSNTFAGSGYGFQRNLIYKIRLSDQRENYNIHPKPHEYDPNLRILDAGGMIDTESYDLGETLLVNYRPDYYQSYIVSYDSGHREQGYPTKSQGADFDTTNYSTTEYKRVDLNYRRILGPKASLALHLATTGVSSYESEFTYGAVDTTDTSSNYDEVELLYETKYCPICRMRLGATLWDTTIQSDVNNERTLDYVSWSKVYGSSQRDNYNEHILYTDQEFAVKRNLRVNVRGESVKHDVGGSRQTSDLTIAYRLADSPVGVYYREGQRWYVNAAESIRPADSWAFTSRYDAGVPGQRTYYREVAVDGLVTPSTFAKVTAFERKRKTYSAASDYRTVDSRHDEDGVNIAVEQQLGRRGNLNVDYTYRDLDDPLTKLPVPNESSHEFRYGAHYFFGDKWHSRFSRAAYSNYYTAASLAAAACGYRKSDLMVYFEPGMSRRYFLHLDNLFGNEVPDTLTGALDNDIKLRIGADAWF